MLLINIIAIVGILITCIATIIVLYNHCKINNFFRPVRSRNNRISPEMFHVLARVIDERNNQARINYEEEKKKEKKLKQYDINNKILIINPDNNLELGISQNK
jgi:hypothetical protein